MRPRIGFLGVGWIGRHRLAAMLATGAVDAAAIIDPSPDCRAEGLKLAPDAPTAATIEEVDLASLDGLVIATPSAQHAAQSIVALDAGLAVFCQKPLGRTADEAHAVVDAARRADRLLAVDLSYRRTAAMEAVTGLVRAGELGSIHAVDLVFHNAYGPDKPWFYDRAQAGGGCVMDLGVHLVDLALWALDFPEVRKVTANLYADGQPVTGNRVEDFALATVELATGCTVRLACSWRAHAGQDAVIGATFFGSQGGAAMRNVAGSFYDLEGLRFRGTAVEALASPPDEWGGRGAADWAVALAGGQRFDPAAERLVAVAEVLDRIYAA